MTRAKKTLVALLYIALTIMLHDLLMIRREIKYDESKAAQNAEKLLIQHLRDVGEDREEYGEPEVSIWHGDALVVFRALRIPGDEIIVSLGKDGSSTVSLGGSPEAVYNKVFKR